MRLTIDETDQKIIQYLQKDAGATNTAIAANLGVSDVTVAGRIRRLIEERVIRPTIFYEPRALGYSTYVVAEVGTDGRDVRDIGMELATIDELQTVVRMLGRPDLTTLFFAKDLEDVERVKNKIAAVPGVHTVNLSPSLKLYKFHNSFGPYGMLRDDE